MADNRHRRCDSCGDSASILVAADERDLMNKKKARTIKELTATNKELKKTLSGVRGQLTKTETKLNKANEKVERWKKETAAQRTAASRSDARVEKLQRKLDRAAAALEPVQAVGPLEAAASGRTVGEPTAADGLTVPDQTWTVVQLRAEARARGLVGMSGKSKAELLDALS
jgi:chromosome segregation ATPase